MSTAQLCLPHPESIWEAVNGTPIAFDQTRLAIVPSQEIDLEEFRVPQEWVDIPEWAADYYLAVQVNLEAGWLRLWGFTTHQQLKNQTEYDALDRTYTVEGEDLYSDLNVLWVTQKLCPQKKAEIQPLPKLSATQAKRLLAQMGKATRYGPPVSPLLCEYDVSPFVRLRCLGSSAISARCLLGSATSAPRRHLTPNISRPGRHRATRRYRACR